MRSTIRRFLDDEAGATAIEYGIIAGVVGLGIVIGLSAIREGLNEIFNNVAEGME